MAGNTIGNSGNLGAGSQCQNACQCAPQNGAPAQDNSYTNYTPYGNPPPPCTALQRAAVQRQQDQDYQRQLDQLSPGLKIAAKFGGLFRGLFFPT